MLWLTILVALAIPLAAVILDSPVVRSLADRNRGPDPAALPPAGIQELAKKVETLESEMEVMNRELGQLRESQQFLQQMLENPAAPRAKLPPKPPE